jgi:hypothetical protein
MFIRVFLRAFSGIANCSRYIQHIVGPLETTPADAQRIELQRRRLLFPRHVSQDEGVVNITVIPAALCASG